MSPKSQDQLLSAAKSGDRQALEALLAQHQDKVYRFGLRLCGNRGDAEDVMQDTLLSVAKSLPTFEGRASFSTWLFAVVRSFCLKKRRQSKFAPHDVAPLDESKHTLAGVHQSQAGQPEQLLRDKELGAMLERAIATLDVDQREVLLLRDVEGLSAAEVAEVLAITESAVKSRLHRARARVREQLLPWLDSGETTVSQGRCPNIVTLYSKYLEGEIDASVCAKMQEHLAECERCGAACNSFKQTLALCGAARATRVPSDVQASVRKALARFLEQAGDGTGDVELKR